MSKGPVLIDLDDSDVIAPDAAPPVPEDAPDRAAMQTAAHLAARRGSRLARWFWGSLLALVGFAVSVTAWDFITGLLARSPLLGTLALGLTGIFCLVLVLIALRELSALLRLRRVDRLQSRSAEALTDGALGAAREVTDGLLALYKDREDTAWGRAAFKDRQAEVLDADALLGLAETAMLEPLDKRARLEVEAAARRVATVTAVVPLAFADIFTALSANIGMIRRIAEIYGGRSGALGSWRLTRSVLTHLVATGAVAVGDDLIGSVAGGGVLSKVSRRFGEGVVNGALTARVGVAAMEVCRPLPFGSVARPSVSGMVKRALTGLFTRP
ncbi:TIGR01620 family protein [Salibaculum sp.]|uniref:YcjF family protein n=1 Tax=Salibaculum sp. TaxID=2855480 RepID=UPI002B46CA5B|nr:TIGR01620 family protein [Salibaculum sp.]HKL69893.1 TIGR01620 family protein [Salibaculum sp.]